MIYRYMIKAGVFGCLSSWAEYPPMLSTGAGRSSIRIAIDVGNQAFKM